MNQELLAKIDPFLWELLPEKERQIIEKEMSENADFRTEVLKRQLENEAIKQMRQNALRAKMTAWREESAAETTVEETAAKTVEAAVDTSKIVQIKPLRVVWFTPMRLAAAASLALLVVFGGRYWAIQNYSNAALVADFYQKSGDILRGGDDEIFGSSGIEEVNNPALFEAGNKAFDVKNYAEAQQNYSKLTAISFIALARMPLAESYFQLKNYEKTISVYLDVLSDKTTDNAIRQQAEWKLILTYMAADKTANNADFKRLLTEIVNNPTHVFHQQAVDLNQKINSFWWRIVN